VNAALPDVRQKSIPQSVFYMWDGDLIYQDHTSHANLFCNFLFSGEYIL
jgi:hypothetical protein